MELKMWLHEDYQRDETGRGVRRPLGVKRRPAGCRPGVRQQPPHLRGGVGPEVQRDHEGLLPRRGQRLRREELRREGRGLR